MSSGDRLPPQYLDALESQMQVAQAGRLRWIQWVKVKQGQRLQGLMVLGQWVWWRRC